MSNDDKRTGVAKEEIGKCSFKHETSGCSPPELSSGETLKCAMWNVTSMVHKTDEIMEHIVDRDSDIVFLTETWLTSDSNHVTAMVKTYGYELLHCRRKDREKETGGGVGILVKTEMKKKQLKDVKYSSFEHTMVKLFLKNNKSTVLICIYRLQFVSSVTFFAEFTQMLEILVASHDCIVIAGDINIHTETEDSTSRQLDDILDTFNMTQHIKKPTHRMGHTLDIVATFYEKPHLSNIDINEYEDITDHFLVDFKVTCSPEMREFRQVRYRNTGAIDPGKLSSEIEKRWGGVNIQESFGENVTRYTKLMKDLINEEAPERTKIIKTVPNSPWFDNDYKQLRRERRKAEKAFKKSKLTEDHEKFTALRKQTTDLAYTKKREYYQKKLNEGNSKTMYSVVNKLLDKKQETVLPDATSDKELADSFVKYFSDKITKIRDKFKDVPVNKKPSNLPSNVTRLFEFEKTTEDEIRHIVNTYGVKCSPEDPVPVNVLKGNLDVFIPIWKDLVNLSLDTGSIECLKSSAVLPTIKQLDELMDKDLYKNYRPVSNLIFLEKLIERVVALRLEKQMTENHLHSDEENGYKTNHSTEFLMMKVVNDLLMNCDEKKPTILLLLDLSAAFDTVDQEKLLDILKNEIGIEGTALKWFRSFLTDRTQRVKINDAYSEIMLLLYGVTQGSVLGPPLFNIYIRSLYPYIRPLLFHIFGFADDHQLMKAFVPALQVSAFEDIEKCLNMITLWMNEFFLCLNANKTQIIVIYPPSIRDSIIMRGTFINNVCVRFVKYAKNLGIILDEMLTFDDQVKRVVKACICTIKKIAEIKSFLTEDDLKTVVCAGVLSRLDYCNALYYGITEARIKKLQSVQNSAVHLIRKRMNQHVSTAELLKKFHWLPVKKRIAFKILLVVHKCLLGEAPVSLRSMIVMGGSTRTKKLEEGKCNGEMGERSFSIAGPKLWNLLPMEVRVEENSDEFKKKLKTFLFREIDNPNSKF